MKHLFCYTLHGSLGIRIIYNCLLLPSFFISIVTTNRNPVVRLGWRNQSYRGYLIYDQNDVTNDKVLYFKLIEIIKWYSKRRNPGDRVPFQSLFRLFISLFCEVKEKSSFNTKRDIRTSNSLK